MINNGRAFALARSRIGDETSERGSLFDNPAVELLQLARSKSTRRSTGRALSGVLVNLVV